MFRGIDLFSDTKTRPDREMRRAICDAEVGDEQECEDPTTSRLEQMTATLLAHDRAVFLPSATMANEIAIAAQTEPGTSVLAAENSHIALYEVGGPAVHSGVMLRSIPTPTGIFSGEDVSRQHLPDALPHIPHSSLVSVENTTNAGGGIAWPRDDLQSVLDEAKRLQLRTHLDGARLLNASIKSGCDPAELAGPFDTVTLCLSKGLGCPVGALLACSKALEPKVRRLKHLMGGAMRQTGILAAAGIHALENNVDRLAEDHEHAALLAGRLAENVPQINVENDPPSTNMLFFSLAPGGITPDRFKQDCLARGLRFSRLGPNRFRAVMHLDVSRGDVERAATIIRDVCEGS